MSRLLVPLALVMATCLSAKDDDVVFKSDVSLTRVDAQVLDRDGHAVTGLQVNDFVLRVDGRVMPIRNFASENMPIDIVLLLDVSGSMKPHVQRIASAAHDALNVLADKDRVAIMVFDTSTRVRLPFRNSHSEVADELNHLLRSERFSRGTQITRAMLDAADYLQREARADARRAIVILTDDQTQDQEDETRVEGALSRANAVLSFLQAPYETPSLYGGGRRHGTWGSGGGGWPGGGGIGFPGGGPITLGRRGPGGYGGADHSRSAGTATIAHDSGGDTMQVEDASALEDTLAKLRQRYTLHFNASEGANPGGQKSVQVELSQQARIRYRDAEVRSRRVYLSGGSGDRNGPTVVTRAQEPANANNDPSPTNKSPSQDQTQPKRRRVAVNDDSGTQPTIQPQPTQQGGWPRADQQQPQPPNP
jgi:hypothetical protein